LYCEVDGVAVKLRPQDLTLAGLFVPGADLSPVDREVRLVLHGPIGELPAKAQVVQVITKERARAEGREAGTGLLFINLGDEDRAFVGLTLDALLRTSQTHEAVSSIGEKEARPLKPAREDEPAGRETGAKSGGRSEPRPARRPEPSKRSEAGAYRHSPAEAPHEIDNAKRESESSKRDAGAYRQSLVEAPREVVSSKREPEGSKRDTGTYRQSLVEAPREVASNKRELESKRDAGAYRQSLAEAPREPRPAREPDGGKAEIARDVAPNRSAAPPEAPRKEPAKKRSPEADKMLRQLEQDLAAIQNKPPWAVLGLTAEAQLDAARAAFLGMSKRYHPHAYARFDTPEVSRLATEIFIAHKKAFSALQTTLKSAPATTSANAPVSQPGAGARVAVPPKTSLRAPPVPQIDIAFPPAPAAAPAPQPSLRPKPAVRSSSSWPPPKQPSQPPPRASAPTPPISARRASDAERAIGAGVKHLAASRFDDAAVEFERARALHPGGRDPELWLRVCHARHAKAEGQRDETLAFYREVLELDPEHREALDYVNSQTPRKRSGLIQKLFGPDDE
jgi:tetratricopeptide (TPR) repeat protein